jgi:3-oxoacyl-[acyl-carrier protein] reductase
MPFDFKGRKVVVAGGSRGIGRSIALTFADSGAAVSTCARGREGVERVGAELSSRGGKVHAAVCDLSSADAIKSYIAEAAQALGGIDVLVNNASGFNPRNDEGAWAANMAVDIMGTVRGSEAALPYLRKGQRPSIVNTSSISGYVASARTPSYGAVKAAVIHYTMTQAVLLAPDRIRVNSVAPGAIEFPGGNWGRRKTEDPELYERVKSRIPFGRYGTPEEVANTALFLASDEASWITGHTLVVDGGQMLGVGV